MNSLKSFVRREQELVHGHVLVQSERRCSVLNAANKDSYHEKER